VTINNIMGIGGLAANAAIKLCTPIFQAKDDCSWNRRAQTLSSADAVWARDAWRAAAPLWVRSALAGQNVAAAHVRFAPKADK